MLQRPGRHVYVVTLFILPALTQDTASTNIPQSVQSAVPACAQACLADQIVQDFPLPICFSTDDLDCLCSHYGLDGYSLGERAFGCLFSSNCSADVRANATSVYNICRGKSNAVTPTQKTVVVTAASSSLTATTSTSASESAMATSIAPSSPPSTVTLASSSSAKPAMSTKNPIPLTDAQVAGIAIASIALVVLTVGIAGCLLFIRRRNKRLEQEESELLFHHSRNASGSGSNFGSPPKDPRPSTGRLGTVPIHRPEPGNAAPGRNWPRYYPIMPGNDIGVAQTSNLPQPVPPARTTTNAQPVQPAYHVPQLARDRSWTAPRSQRQSVGNIPRNPPAPPDPPAVSPLHQVSQAKQTLPRSSRSSADVTPPSRPPIFNLPVIAPQRKASANQQPRAPKRVTPTRRGRQDIDRIAVVSQVTEFEEDASGRPTAVEAVEGEPSQNRQSSQPSQLSQAQHNLLPPQHPPLQHPGISDPDFPNNYQSNDIAIPKPPAAVARPGSIRPQRLRIHIPSYPSSSSTSIRESQVPTRLRQIALQDNQKEGSNYPNLKVPMPKSALVSESRGSPRVKNKPSFTIAQISPEESPRKQPSPRSDPSSTLRSSGVFPTTIAVEGGSRAEARNSKSRRRSSKGKGRQSQSFRASYASYTSFESAGSDDDPTPPEEDKQLSAVSERSPISDLKYPKIPRASNQAVPRKPPSPKHRTSPSDNGSPKKLSPTPPPKQKNTTPGNGVENQLWRTELGQGDGLKASTRGTPPLRIVPVPNLPLPLSQEEASNLATIGYYQPRTPQPHSWSWAPMSPFGLTPKLTPTKHGDDLYLKVG